ncbi:MAG: hypothetical protein CL759_05530 [Chloroflexi bacterium]|nr:hypothetical protein [Chloroflexota bacterium]MQF94605.1 hypothetical protein [SAR202 cluster bacterium]
MGIPFYRKVLSTKPGWINVNMVKVSISLPNNTQITFESEEAEVLHEVVGMVLRDLPRELMGSQPAAGPNPASAEEKGTSVATSALAAAVATTPETPQAEAPAPIPAPVEDTPVPAPAQETPATTNGNGTRQETVSVPPELMSEEVRRDFAAFCQGVNPVGDMKRVVVAAEGASRHFGLDGVNADELGLLFDMAGWRKPGNFTQTLRNAARSKFGWLERIPGRSGRYATTPVGLEKTSIS